MADVEVDAEIIRLGYHLDMTPASFVSDELSNLAHGQRRTGAHKKAVFISSEHVYKGPYLASSPGDTKRLLYNLYFTRALLTLEQHLKVPDHLRSIMDWESVIKIDHTDEYYLKQKCIGKLSTSNDDHEIVTTKVEINVKVLRRGSHVNRLIELEKDESNFQDDDKHIFQACVQHFYLRFILNIGDSGTWNILVRRDDVKGIYGIDFEEIRAQKQKKSNDPLTMIMSKVSKHQRNFYGPYTNKITIFENPIDLLSELGKTLSTLFKIDVEQMNGRIKDYANSIVKNK
jgi:hypothetical protein